MSKMRTAVKRNLAVTTSRLKRLAVTVALAALAAIWSLYAAPVLNTELETTDSIETSSVSTSVVETASSSGLVAASESTIAELVSEPPAYMGEPYILLNNNIPCFSEQELSVTESYENYGALDSLGRCTTCIANIGQDIMPNEGREEIGSVKPTGWVSQKDEHPAVYNRCHLIGFQLAGENANDRNLITGTRAMNVDGMLPFENMVADYVKETGNHVLYRVTPVFLGEELVARGVVMEAQDIEENGDGVRFCVYCYNAQSGIIIDYKTGKYTKGDG